MRIAILQFAPEAGDINNNLNRADGVLSKGKLEDIDLLVLPELAFTGYYFSSPELMEQMAEPTASGITQLWARTRALQYNCAVGVGYPEKVEISNKYYNSVIFVDGNGDTIAKYRKCHLNDIDKTWAIEGSDGFYDGEIESLGTVVIGISTDLKTHKSLPRNTLHFPFYILHKQANLVIVCMAWPATENYGSYCRQPKEPDMTVLEEWLKWIEPLIRAETEEEIICVFANLVGKQGEVAFAGTSAVLGIIGGEVKLYGILGRCEKELLVVDTHREPRAKVVHDRTLTASEEPHTLDHNETISMNCGTFSPPERPKSPKSRNSSQTRLPNTQPAQLYSSAELSILLDNLGITPLTSNRKNRSASVPPESKSV